MLHMVLRLLLLMTIFFFASNGQAYETIPVSLTIEESGSAVELRQGQALNISLHANGSSGFFWYVETGAELILKQGETNCIINSSCGWRTCGCGTSSS